MNGKKRLTTDFLRKYQMHYDQIDFMKEVYVFKDEIEVALNGKQSSLKINPSYINFQHVSIRNKEIIAIDIGGTNVKIAKVMFDSKGKARIHNLKNYKMQGSAHAITKEEFIETICSYIIPYMQKKRKIAVSFGYNIKSTEKLDVEIEKLSKEVSIVGIEKILLGEEIQRELKKQGYESVETTITNDIIATIFSGIECDKRNKFDTYIGLIVGTGTNTCYIEKTSQLRMLYSKYFQDSMIINTESGDYSKQHRGVIDIEYDEKTNNTGDHLLEKMVGGKYLGPLTMNVLKKAAQEGLFSSGFFKKEFNELTISTKELNHILKSVKLLSDSQTVKQIIRNMIRRAAKLMAIVVTAEAIKSKAENNSKYKALIIAEGTTFYQLKGFKKWVQRYLKKWLTQQSGIRFKLLKVENATLKGVAALGLSRFQSH